jgi:hypothetical protein
VPARQADSQTSTKAQKAKRKQQKQPRFKEQPNRHLGLDRWVSIHGVGSFEFLPIYVCLFSTLRGSWCVLPIYGCLFSTLRGSWCVLPIYVCLFSTLKGVLMCPSHLRLPVLDS